MKTVTFPRGLQLGPDVIDRQHAQFFTLMNRLIEAETGGEDRELVAATIAELADYVHSHFRTEEELMEQYGYPALEEHQLQHAKFAGCVEDFHRKFSSGLVGLEEEILAYLVEWFTDHIRHEDAKYVELFRENGH